MAAKFKGGIFLSLKNDFFYLKTMFMILFLFYDYELIFITTKILNVNIYFFFNA